MQPIVVSTSPSRNCNINPGPVLLTGSLDQLIHDACAVGADGIELRCVTSDLTEAHSIKQRVSDAGLIFGGISTGRLVREEGLVFSHTDPQLRKRAAEALCRMIDIARIFDTDILIGSAKGNQHDDEPLEAYTDRLADCLAVADRYAEGSGVKIQIEAINRYEINALTTGRATAEFIETYALNNCYVHLDTFHMNIEEADLPTAIRGVGEHLGYFQFADSNRRWPGEGHIDFGPIFAALNDVHFTGVWSLEYQPFPNGFEAARNGVAFLRSFAAEAVAA
ncbi:sugar phosphate isomerase/epimerase [Arcanobacterium haemolyticum]|nr:sugar phosphate isomerase/epimerase [Arcanobacterium haemolyticum]